MILSIERLSKQFKNKIVVDNVSVRLEDGVYGFLGANGAGKTTLIQMLCGILLPTSGEVKIDGKNNISMGEEFRDMVGYLPQEFGYTQGFTAKDFMLYIASIKGLKPQYAKKKTEELLELVNLAENRDMKIRTFSGGMKRRIGIAQALLNDPRILILDEPTAGLDPKERAYFRGIISEMSKDKIIIISTHIVSDIEYISDQILIMKKGKFILKGIPDELIRTIDGMVWECSIPQNRWREFEKTQNIVNAHNHDNVVDARVICENKPDITANMVSPSLEDLYLKSFANEINGGRKIL